MKAISSKNQHFLKLDKFWQKLFDNAVKIYMKMFIHPE